MHDPSYLLNDRHFRWIEIWHVDPELDGVDSTRRGSWLFRIRNASHKRLHPEAWGYIPSGSDLFPAHVTMAMLRGQDLNYDMPPPPRFYDRLVLWLIPFRIPHWIRPWQWDIRFPVMHRIARRLLDRCQYCGGRFAKGHTPHSLRGFDNPVYTWLHIPGVMSILRSVQHSSRPGWFRSRPGLLHQMCARHHGEIMQQERDRIQEGRTGLEVDIYIKNMEDNGTYGPTPPAPHSG